MRRRTLCGLALVMAMAAALEAFRLVWFEPRAIGLACLRGTGPAGICALRSGLALATHDALWGVAALGLGMLAFVSARFGLALAAVSAGVGGLINYNVSWGMLGAALGAWVWLRT